MARRRARVHRHRWRRARVRVAPPPGLAQDPRGARQPRLRRWLREATGPQGRLERTSWTLPSIPTKAHAHTHSRRGFEGYQKGSLCTRRGAAERSKQLGSPARTPSNATRPPCTRARSSHAAPDLPWHGELTSWPMAGSPAPWRAASRRNLISTAFFFPEIMACELLPLASSDGFSGVRIRAASYPFHVTFLTAPRTSTT